MKPVDNLLVMCLSEMRRAGEMGDAKRQANCARFLSAAVRVFRRDRPGGDACYLEVYPQAHALGGGRSPLLVVTTQATIAGIHPPC